MRMNGLVMSLSLGVLTAVIIAACDDKTPTAPTPTPVAPTAPALVRLEIVGPRSVAPGETVQFAATGHFADGSTRNMTNEASWTTGRPTALTVDSGGKATGQVAGESSLDARVGSAASAIEVMVVPAGTFRLSVVLREAGSIPPSATSVEVTGTGLRLFDPTPESGRYDFYGVAGFVQLRITAVGYRNHFQELLVADHTILDVEMLPVRPRADVSGRFTLTIEAHEACRHALPEDLRIRRYVAQIKQFGPQFSVELEGADFASNYFWGSLLVDSSAAWFYFSNFSYYDYSAFPGVTERLDASHYLVFAGIANTTVGASSLSGVFEGSIQLLEIIQGRPNRRIAECQSRHPFLLSR